MARSASGPTRKKATARGRPVAQLPAARSYLAESERPWASLLFLLPLLIAYELYVAGAFATRPGGIGGRHPPRITAFILLEELFQLLGAAGEHLPALALIGMLLAAHLTRRDSWRVNPTVLLAMGVECIAWAAPLLVLGWGVARLLPLARTEVAGNFLFLSLGAGIYEEMLFRLIGVTLLVTIFRDGFRWRPGAATTVAIAISGVLFSLYHYLGTGEHFLLGPAIFRTLAGIYLGVMYAIRGFGVTSGAHAAYDLAIACFY